MSRAACPVQGEAYVSREHHNRLAILAVIRYSTLAAEKRKNILKTYC